MLWNLPQDSSVQIDDGNDQEFGQWWPQRCDGFGLPFVAAIIGYQPEENWNSELVLPINSPSSLG